MQKTKVAVIGTVGLPAKYGGFETLTQHLAEELGSRIDLSVYCSGKKYPKAQRTSHYKGTRLIYLPFEANGIQSIIYDCISILHALFFADVLLILGVSGGILLPLVRLFTRKKIIVSIDGIEWKRSKWSRMARWYLWAAEWIAVKCSHADIADNESIQDYTAMRYNTLSSIIEYGADHTMVVCPEAADRAKYPFLNSPYAFTVCRIEPENNIHLILEAFSQLPEQQLVMIGNWQNSEYGQRLREQYARYPNLAMMDPIYNQRELDLIRCNCTLYVHGHSAGGTNPSLVEAMYLGLPVIAYNVMYNRTTTVQQAFYFKTAEELCRTVRSLAPDTLVPAGRVMQELAQSRYTWAIVAGKYEYLIRKVVTKPAKERLASAATRNLSPVRLIQFELGHFHSPSYFYEKR